MNLEFLRINLEFLEITSAFSKPRNNGDLMRLLPLLCSLAMTQGILEFLEIISLRSNDENSKISKAKSQIFLHNFKKFFKHEFCVLYAHFLLAR